MEHFLQGNIPLRHLLNAKPPFISWPRSTFNEVNDWALGYHKKGIPASPFLVKFVLFFNVHYYFFFRPSIFSTLRIVIANESVTGLWKGITPSITRTVPGVGLYFASLHALKTTHLGSTAEKPSPMQAIYLGNEIFFYNLKCAIVRGQTGTRNPGFGYSQYHG